MSTETIIKAPYVNIKPQNNGKIEVNWGFSTFMRTEDNGRISCFIPGFDIYFGVVNKEEIHKKGRAMTKMFMDHFFKHTKDMKSFAFEMHKRGFKAPNDAFTIKQFATNKPIQAKFKAPVAVVVPDDFERSENHEEEMEVAFN